MKTWRREDGSIVACTEKIKVMQQNLDEFSQVAQDIYEDAILMDIDPQQIKAELINLIQAMNNPYKKK